MLMWQVGVIFDETKIIRETVVVFLRGFAHIKGNLLSRRLIVTQ